MSMQNIWRVHLMPGSQEQELLPVSKDRHGHEDEKNTFGFCYQRNIIGICWNLDDSSPDVCKKGDLVWVHNHPPGDLRLYLGKIESDWEDTLHADTDETKEIEKEGITDFCRCTLHEVRVKGALQKYVKHIHDSFEKDRNYFKKDHENQLNRSVELDSHDSPWDEGTSFEEHHSFKRMIDENDVKCTKEIWEQTRPPSK